MAEQSVRTCVHCGGAHDTSREAIVQHCFAVSEVKFSKHGTVIRIKYMTTEQLNGRWGK